MLRPRSAATGRLVEMRFDYLAADDGVIAQFNEGRNTTFD
jgi:hypothetical protein